MSFSRIKPAGWAFSELLTSGQMNALDVDHANALDGLAGGAYTPSPAIEIGGAGIALDGTNHLVLAGARLTVQSTGEIEFAAGSVLDVNGTALFDDLAFFDAAVEFSAHVEFQTAEFFGGVDFDAAVGFADPVTINSTLTISSTLTANGNVTLGSDDVDALIVNADAAFVATAVFLGDITIANPAILSGDGRIRYRTSVISADANATVTPVTADVYFIANGVLTAGRDWSISDTGCSNGDWILLVTEEQTQIITIKDPSAANIVQIRHATGNPASAKVMRIGGAWHVVEQGKF